MSTLDFELFVVKTIIEHAQDSYLSEIALRRLFLAIKRIAHEHAKAGLN
jgi:hypothetical protein